MAQKREVKTKFFFSLMIFFFNVKGVRGLPFSSVSRSSLFKLKICQKETFKENY